MEIKILSLIFILLCTVNCKSPESNDFYVNDDYEIQNDNTNYGVEYDELEEPEESRGAEVEKPLKILTSGQEFIKNLSETVVLPCEISGNNFVQVWRKKKAIDQNSRKTDAVIFQSSMSMAAAPNMKQLPDGSLEISNLHIQDQGEYECSAMDTKNNSPKIKHRVILRVPPQIESLAAKDNINKLRNGQTLLLMCKASGYPKPVISWHKGSSRLDIEGETLEYPKVEYHHAGTYKCLADNKIGEPAFSYIDIKVEYKPHITVDRILVSSENHSETELQCLVHAEPRAVVTWTKDGVDIPHTKRTQLINKEHKHNLILNDIQDSDFGEYTCTATNAVGSSKKSIKLVKTPAVLGLMRSNSDSKHFVLIWQVQSRPNLTANELFYRKKGEIEWRLLKPEVKYVGTDLYEVRYIFREELGTGEYETKLRSQNYNGWSETSDVLTFVADSTKQEHHKYRKTGHKRGKDKQTPPTPTLPAQLEHVEHEDNENQSDFIKDRATPATGSAVHARSPVLLFSLLLLMFLRNN